MSDSKKSLTERRSFPREFKLRVISHHRSINNNTYKTAKEFNVSTATVRRWVKNEAIILASRSKTRRFGSGRRAAYPELEEALYQSFQKLRQDGMKVNGKWFRSKAEALYKELYPKDDMQFKFSDRWFTNFKRRYHISFRCITKKGD